MAAGSLPFHKPPFTPPPTFPWMQRPPGGNLPPTGLGGWDNGLTPDDGPPAIALIYSMHVTALQRALIRSANPELEEDLLSLIGQIRDLDACERIQLRIDLMAYEQHLRDRLEEISVIALPDELRDSETSTHLEHLKRLMQRIIDLGADLIAFLD